MTPAVVASPWALLFWAVFIWAFTPEYAIILRSSKAVRGAPVSADAKSLQIIVLGMWVGLLAAFPLAAIPRFTFPAAARLPTLAGGTALLAVGSLLRRHSFRVLGEYFTGEVRTVAEQPVITRGAYRYVRHPSYTGGMLMFAGIGIALGSWLSTAVTVATSAAVYAYRVRVEEGELVRALGQAYVDYMRTRKRFVPHVI